MNIKILDSWLREYLETNATAKQIADYLSLCSQSVEKLTKIENDWLYEIEVTNNRPDCFSVYGIARELSVILPRFGIKTKFNLISNLQLPTTKNNHHLSLDVKITKNSLCPRFTAIIFDQVAIKPSPKIVQERLEKSGIRAINNVVDISNYLMLELGQPMHTFDYDKIKKAKMILRESAGGEKITTLDGQIRPLPEGTIIIEDGEGRIIDLCGIMGGANSEVDEQTKRVLLFVQTYDPVKIRQTCQKLAFRTEAASRFEKGVDPEGVIIAMKKAISMFKENCEAEIASDLIDIYPHPPKEKTVKLDISLVNKIMGISIPQKEIVSILESLGFSIINSKLSIINCRVPHWRYNDVSLPEDLVEEIARIYGYHKLPNNLPPTLAQTNKSHIFNWEEKIKNALKFWGFTETINYSLISEQLLKTCEISPLDCLKIANPLSEEWVYLRTSLIPSLLSVVSHNQKSKIKIFEIANIYLPKNHKELPEENPMLTVLVGEEDFTFLKGIVEALLEEIGINQYAFDPYPLQKTFYGKIFHPQHRTEITLGENSLGLLGEIKKDILLKLGIKQKIVIFDLDLQELAKHATEKKIYKPLPKYPPIIEDLSFVIPKKTYVGKILSLIKQTASLIQNVELIDAYQETKTFRITYQDPRKTLTDKEVTKIRKKIINNLKIKLGLKLKGEKEN
jgi:phenylalanyl-tRNA synthetase beta chain